jgi:ATPase subunit of ABC transporter with duplicated ATPase domains
LFRTGKQYIRQGDRIVLLGRNGVGKSCLIRMLKAAIEQPLATGSIRATPSLVLGYADQALNVLSPEETPLAAITRRFDISDQQAHTLLAGAGISIIMQQRATSLLSGGQKARLSMLVLRLMAPNFYLLDEPTNHLDIEGQETLGEELTGKTTSCVLVSHDRSFIRDVANRFWLIEKRKLIEVDDPEDFFASFG